MNPTEAQKLIQWVEEQARTIDYGEVALILKFHDGQLRHIEKRLMHNEKPEPVQAGGSHERTHRVR
jgi:hypothetical protein